MDHQKAKRDDLINHARALAMGDFDEENEVEEEEEEMDTSGEVHAFFIHCSLFRQRHLIFRFVRED